MTTRVLTGDEYPRLVGTELEAVWPHLPASARVIVVEDVCGAIVGCWCCSPACTPKGSGLRRGIDASRGAIARRLMAGMREQLETLGASAFMTGAVSDPVRRIITKLGGARSLVSST
jgi:hypothetical protein